MSKFTYFFPGPEANDFLVDINMLYLAQLYFAFWHAKCVETDAFEGHFTGPDFSTLETYAERELEALNLDRSNQ